MSLQTLSQTEENYLKAIYHLQWQDSKSVSTNAIAKKMDTKASSVTDMLRKLAEKQLVNYKKYQGVSLTKAGEKVASTIIRKHRLWEVFLVETLNFSWDEVHDVAEQLEHIKSTKLINELDSFLGFPSHDPHGDPIPDKNGIIKTTDKIILAKAELGKPYTCVGVLDSNTEFLQYLNKHQIGLGTKIEPLSIEVFDNSMHIKINDNHKLMVSKTIANNLFVK